MALYGCLLLTYLVKQAESIRKLCSYYAIGFIHMRLKDYVTVATKVSSVARSLKLLNVDLG